MALNFNLNDQLQRYPSPHRMLRQTRTSNFTIRVRQSGTLYDNLGATGAVVFTLPTNAVAGHRYAFMVKVAQDLTIDPGEDSGIRINGSLQTDGDTITASTVGDYVELVRDQAGDWDAVVSSGTWSTPE